MIDSVGNQPTAASGAARTAKLVPQQTVARHASRPVCTPKKKVEFWWLKTSPVWSTLKKCCGVWTSAVIGSSSRYGITWLRKFGCAFMSASKMMTTSFSVGGFFAKIWNFKAELMFPALPWMGTPGNLLRAR